jgi:hypothetical protein
MILSGEGVIEEFRYVFPEHSHRELSEKYKGEPQIEKDPVT